MSKIEKIRLVLSIILWVIGIGLVWYYSEWVTLFIIFIFQAIQNLDNRDKFKRKS
jgi:hypothetical protein